MRRIAILLLGVLLSGIAWAQDPQHSQFYSVPQLMNPAHAGSKLSPRATFNYRNQWPSVPGAFVTYFAAYDFTLEDRRTGIGIIAQTDKAGSVGLRSTFLAGQASYLLPIDNKIRARAGLQMSIYNRNVDFFRLTFPDQLSPDGVEARSTLENYDDFSNVWFASAAAGGLIFSEKWWAGMAIHHLNEPRQSMVDGELVYLPMRFSWQAGYKLWLKKPRGILADTRERTFTPMMNLRVQRQFKQLDIGVYFNIEPIIFGTFYRGMPFIPNKFGVFNQDALILMTGIRLREITFAYSYDHTLSILGGQANGSHEITLNYYVETNTKKRTIRKMQQTFKNFPFPHY